jgi:hypothetical protein
MIHQAWRQRAETLYRSLPKEEMNSRWNKDLRASLEELRDYQAVDAPDWFLAKERLDAMFRDEKERRADRDGEQSQSTPFFSESGTDDEDEDEETDSDLEGASPVDSADDGNIDDLGMTMEELTIMNAYQEAAATKGKSAKGPAEVGKMKEETQLGAEAEAVDVKEQSSARTATDAVSRKPGAVARGNEADVEHPKAVDLQCKQCDQEFPNQQALGSHIVEAHPGEALEAVVLALVDERFNALIEEKRGDARKEPDWAGHIPAETNTLLLRETIEASEKILRETTQARAKLSQEIHEARAKLDQREARLEHKFIELQDQLIQTFGKLVGLADKHLDTTVDQNVAHLVAGLTKSVEQKAQRMREIAKSEHDMRAKEAAQSEIDALDAEQALQEQQLAAQQAQLKARHAAEQEQLATQQALSAAQSAARKEVLQGKLEK